ncbi:MAG: efflux RND transporter permease subunit, partial [Planctomycetes bacterium]|nr:efflux RND transporter permease subunit [Planctomycetota bacterium]
MKSNQGSIETLFLRNRQLLVLSIVVSIAAGLFGVRVLDRFEDPRITNLYPIIVTPFPGASAERVETLVTEKLEDELAEVDTIKEITSTSIAGVSIINLELVKSTTESTYREIFAEIRDKIGNAARSFPAGVGEPIFDDKRDPAAFSLMVAVKWDHDSDPQLGILDRIAEDLADRLRAIRGTEMVRLYGAPEEELTVEVDHRDLAALGLDASSLAERIAESDSKQPAGTLRGARSDVLLEVKGEIDSVTRVQRLPFTEGDDQSVVRVGDIAEVRRGWHEPPREIGLIDGRRSVIVAARMGRERRIDVWSEDALAAVSDFGALVGDGVGIDVIFEQARYTNARFAQLAGNLLIAAVVVAGVVFVMMGWRLGLIVGAALPIVVSLTVFTFVVIGETLHQMSVYGIVIALGLLIDNAIVMGDEVNKRKAEGLSPAEAVTGSVRHLFLPLLASTLTTILAFMPIVLLPGGPGDFVGAIGKSVIIAVSWSFLTALTVTAALAGIFARPTPHGSRRRFLRDGIGHRRLTAAYRWSLTQGLRAPIAAIAVALALPLAGFMLAPSLGNSFFPPADRDMFEIRVWLPNDSSIHNTRAHAEAIETVVREDPEVTRVFWLVGGSFPRVYYNVPMDQDNSAHFAQAIVGTTSDAATKRVLDGLQHRLDAEFPGAQILVKQLRQGPPLVADVEYRLYGPSVEGLIEVGERIRRTLQADPEVVVTQATMTRGEPKLWFEPSESEARVAGLSLGEIAAQLRSNLDGSLGGTMIEDLEELPVRVRYRDERRRTLSSIASTNLVQVGVDRWIPLEALGDIELRPDLASTTRYGGVRSNMIKGYTTIDALPINVAQRVLATLDAEGFELPAGYRIEMGGTVEQEVETRGDMMAPLPMIAVFMAAILILTFRSVLLAVILGVIAVMSVGMAVLSTWLIDFPISFNTFMGTFGLIGVALNDSIIVIAAIRGNPRAAAGEIDGIVDATMDTTRHVIA